MLIPVSDDDSKLVGPYFVTLGLIALNLVVFFLFQKAGADGFFTYGWSVIPLEITSGTDLVEAVRVQAGGQSVLIPQAPGPTPIYLTVFSAMFMHGGLGHLFGNLLYLWIFGDNLEDRFGPVRFLLFYLACGVFATAVQIGIGPDSVIPNLGASGAISGVMGGYLVLFPRNSVNAIFFFRVLRVPAFIALGMWILMQLVGGWGTISTAGGSVGGVAYGAHIGGFVAGVMLALLLKNAGTPEVQSV